MKTLYARFVLWLIRPALDSAALAGARQGGVIWRISTRKGPDAVVPKSGQARTRIGESVPRDLHSSR